ncbi:MAG: hypothetical protein JJT82_01935 [Legionellaceae bacterium]|nr:hypothetical protein [Legionellaceae bacterium]
MSTDWKAAIAKALSLPELSITLPWLLAQLEPRRADDVGSAPLLQSIQQSASAAPFDAVFFSELREYLSNISPDATEKNHYHQRVEQLQALWCCNSKLSDLQEQYRAHIQGCLDTYRYIAEKYAPQYSEWDNQLQHLQEKTQNSPRLVADVLLFATSIVAGVTLLLLAAAGATPIYLFPIVLLGVAAFLLGMAPFLAEVHEQHSTKKEINRLATLKRYREDSARAKQHIGNGKSATIDEDASHYLALRQAVTHLSDELAPERLLMAVDVINAEFSQAESKRQEYKGTEKIRAEHWERLRQHSKGQASKIGFYGSPVRPKRPQTPQDTPNRVSRIPMATL